MFCKENEKCFSSLFFQRTFSSPLMHFCDFLNQHICFVYSEDQLECEGREETEVEEKFSL